MPEGQPRITFAWIAAALIALALGYRLLGPGDSPAPPVEVAEGGAAGAAGAQTAGGEGEAGAPAGGGRRVYVHVAGAVRRPGLYRLPQGARVARAIAMAGGPRPKADLTGTNLAARLEDGQQIVVAARGVAVPGAGAASGPAAAGAVSAPGAPGAPGAPISLATATQAQLEELDGIGPALASRILEYRDEHGGFRSVDEHGGFRSVDELGEVDGIGEVRLEALRAAVRP